MLFACLPNGLLSRIYPSVIYTFINPICICGVTKDSSGGGYGERVGIRVGYGGTNPFSFFFFLPRKFWLHVRHGLLPSPNCLFTFSKYFSSLFLFFYCLHSSTSSAFFLFFLSISLFWGCRGGRVGFPKSVIVC